MARGRGRALRLPRPFRFGGGAVHASRGIRKWLPSGFEDVILSTVWGAVPRAWDVQGSGRRAFRRREGLI